MKPWPLGLLISGVVVSLGAPLVGLLVTVLSMVGAFHQLGESGISDPKILATHVGNALMGTMAGLVFSVGLGVPMIMAGIVVHFVTRKPPGVTP